MPKNSNVGGLLKELYGLLKDLESVERRRVVQATMTLFGESIDTSPDNIEMQPSVMATQRKQAAPPDGAQKYFDQKDPRNKGEEFAVAARFLEESENCESCKREDMKRIITGARRNFDDANFSRDMKNATCQAGFFNKGTGRGLHKLSYYGQQYVDALPDRNKAKARRRPIRKATSAKKAKRKSTKA